MWLIVIGTLLVLAKWLEFGPVASWSWLVVLIPYALAFAWFEVVEPLFGLDKKKMHDDVAKVKAERIKDQLDRGSHKRR